MLEIDTLTCLVETINREQFLKELMCAQNLIYYRI